MIKRRSLVVFVWKFVVSLAVTTTIIIGGVLLPSQAATHELATNVGSVKNLFGALQASQASLKKVTGPVVIKLQTPDSAKNYAWSLNTALTNVDAKLPAPPHPFFNPLGDSKVTHYNALMNDPEYAKALTAAGETLTAAKAFLSHHQTVMEMLKNLLEYNPTHDTDVQETELLVAHLEAAANGLAATQQRLEAVGDKDETLSRIEGYIKDVETARQDYRTAIAENRPTASQRTVFIQAVAKAQAQIITNRQAFWDDSISAQRESVAKAVEQLRPYVGRLNNL